jgi:hypothetical protein
LATVTNTVPASLRPEVDAALAWFNESQEETFEVTGIVDPEVSLASDAPRELRLVLCGGDSCQQQSFWVAPAEGGFEVSLSATTTDSAPGSTDHEVQAELDPPPGARRSWLASAIRRHEFVVLVFYRGFW